MTKTKKTAANNNFLRNTKRIFNTKIYKKALRLVNTKNETAARAYVQKFKKEPLSY